MVSGAAAPVFFATPGEVPHRDKKRSVTMKSLVMVAAAIVSATLVLPTVSQAQTPVDREQTCSVFAHDDVPAVA
jgi:hypothetical protein